LPRKYIPKHIRLLVGIDRSILVAIFSCGANSLCFFIRNKGKSWKA